MQVSTILNKSAAYLEPQQINNGANAGATSIMSLNCGVFAETLLKLERGSFHKCLRISLYRYCRHHPVQDFWCPSLRFGALRVFDDFLWALEMTWLRELPARAPEKPPQQPRHKTAVIPYIPSTSHAHKEISTRRTYGVSFWSQTKWAVWESVWAGKSLTLEHSARNVRHAKCTVWQRRERDISVFERTLLHRADGSLSALWEHSWNVQSSREHIFKALLFLRLHCALRWQLFSSDAFIENSVIFMKI